MWVVGVDENGLGPRLGPLVATAVTIEVTDYRPARLARHGLALGVRDSKQAGGFGRMAAMEAIALPIVRAALGDVADADALIDRLVLGGRSALQTDCPPGPNPACWGHPPALPAFAGPGHPPGARRACATRSPRPEDGKPGRAADGDIFAALARRGIRVASVQSALLCAGALNAAMTAGQSKLDLDLHLFERLVLAARAQAPEEISAICGMVGGIRDYPPRFRHLPRDVVRLPATAPNRRYAVPGVGRISFEVDADSRHLPVSLASMVGKYLREILVERQFRALQGAVPNLRRASGYHDPVTAAFIEQTSSARRHLPLIDACFERVR